jgi:uncharacterized protein (DUF2062 family)
LTWVRRRLDRLRYLWRAALEENADPHKFAFAVAVGTVVSASPVPPVLGLRSAAAVGGAWITRCSKLTTWLSCHIFAGPLWVFAAMIEVRVGSFLLRRSPPTWGHSASERLDTARHALLAWWIGGVLFAPVCGFIAYWIARPIARRYLERRARRLAAEAASASAATPPATVSDRVSEP